MRRQLRTLLQKIQPTPSKDLTSKSEPDHSEAQRLLDQYEPLIHKTLYRCQIWGNHPHSEDYQQLLRLQLLKIAERFGQDPLDEAERGRFVHYASQGLYWHLIDLLRRDSRQQEPLVSLDQASPTTTTSSRIPLAGANLFVRAAQRVLAPEELSLFYKLTEGTWSVQSLADYYGVTPRTIHRRRERLAHQLAPYKDLLQG